MSIRSVILLFHLGESQFAPTSLWFWRLPASFALLRHRSPGCPLYLLVHSVGSKGRNMLRPCFEPSSFPKRMPLPSLARAEDDWCSSLLIFRPYGAKCQAVLFSLSPSELIQFVIWRMKKVQRKNRLLIYKNLCSRPVFKTFQSSRKSNPNSWNCHTFERDRVDWKGGWAMSLE